MTLNTSFLVGLTTLFFALGCNAPDKESCEYWGEQLSKGKKQKKSIVRIGELECTDAADQLLADFPDSVYRNEIIIAIATMGQTDAGVSIVKQAINDREVGPLAISVARRWRVDGLHEMLHKIIRAERNASTRQPSLEALLDLTSPLFVVIGTKQSANDAVIYERATDDDIVITVAHVQADKPSIESEGGAITVKANFKDGYKALNLANMVQNDPHVSALVRCTHGGDGSGDTKASDRMPLERRITNMSVIETLMWTVGQDPALQGVETNQYAAQMMEAIDWQAMSGHERYAELIDRATQNLIKALFAKDNRGNAAQLQARMALRSIGSRATGRLLEAFEGKNRELNEFIEVRGLPEWKTNMGPELVEMLWDVGNRNAAKPLMCAIGRSLDPPPDVARLEPDERTEWKQANNNRLTTSAFAVGALADDTAVSCATDLLKTNDEIDISQFKNAGLALGLMGTKLSEEALWTLFSANDEKIKSLDDEIAKLVARKASANTNAAKKRVRTAGKKAEREKEQLIDKKANFVVNLAVGLSETNAARFKREVLDLKKGPIKESADQPLPKAYYALVNECGSSGRKYLDYLKQYHGEDKDKKKKLTLLVEEVQASQKAVVDAGAEKTNQMNEWWKQSVTNACKKTSAKSCIAKVAGGCAGQATLSCKGKRGRAKKRCVNETKKKCTDTQTKACTANAKVDPACQTAGETKWLADTGKFCADNTALICEAKWAKKCAKKQNKKCGDEKDCAFDLSGCQKKGNEGCTKSYPKACLAERKSLNGQIKAASKNRNKVAKELKTIGKLHKDKSLGEKTLCSKAPKALGDITAQFQLNRDHGQKKSPWTKKSLPCKNRLAEYYNWRVNDYNAAIDTVDGLWKQVDRLDAELIAPKQKAMQAQVQKIQKLEKAVLMLGSAHVDDDLLDEAFPIICDLFLDGNPEYFPQFRQWTLIYLEHTATPAHHDLVESVYRKELDQSPRGGTFWTLRLQSLEKRLQVQ
jgi:hypothetical protein